jgi:hypothetical protein
MSVALKHDIAKPFKGESHDDDATFLFLFAGALAQNEHHVGAGLCRLLTPEPTLVRVVL